MIAFGYYKVGQTNQQNNQQKYFERKTRYAIAPILQAEADRVYAMRELVNLKKEASIMKGVEGWNSTSKNSGKAYYSERFMPRAIDNFDTQNIK